MTRLDGTVLTIGGGGFSMPEVADAGSIDDFLLGLTGRDTPRVCFVGTASGDAASYVERFVAAFDGRARTSVLALFGNGPDGAIPLDRLDDVLEQDVVYVGGGSTANLLAVWRLHGLPELLAEAARRGTVLAGISAGMNCWFEASSTDSFGPYAPLRDGLGLLRGSACPHYRGEPGRRETYLRWVGTGALPDGYAADDGVALLWRGGELVEAVGEARGASAYRVHQGVDGAVETPVPTRLLAG
ncbi:peptidase E [Cellulomonas wangsupingiae]|uniref:Peptidase E n=1 Tax=Cellulomonas wangsupingiae TaxID=2968085 RepID=A0ABY5K4P0_9CELL|nr:peptidase E [Cellulomonas wangsupingiae]MCC2333761.1 peptidase E [Cellulomonas wangsupingiae]UUI65023.1 peptidase E [Cellulomonas wangsupingiae]